FKGQLKLMFNKAPFIFFFITAIFCLNTSAQLKTDSGTIKIRLNQIGFYPGAPKLAVIITSKGGSFSLQNENNKKVYRGVLKRSVQADLSGKYTWIADFSACDHPGKYTLTVPGVGVSYPFIISRSVHQKVADAAIKAFYYMRASIPLEDK